MGRSSTSIMGEYVMEVPTTFQDHFIHAILRHCTTTGAGSSDHGHHFLPIPRPPWDSLDQQMPSLPSSLVSVRHHNSGRKISRALRIQPRRNNQTIPILIPTGATIKAGLGKMDQFLAWLNVHRRQTESSLGRMDQFHTSDMELVLRQKMGGSISYYRLKNHALH